MADFQRPDHGKRPQRFTQDRSADLELFGKIPFRQQAIAGLQLPGKQLLAQKADDALIAASALLLAPD